MNCNIALKLGDTTFHTIGCLFTSEEEINKETKRHKEKTNLRSVYIFYITCISTLMPTDSANMKHQQISFLKMSHYATKLMSLVFLRIIIMKCMGNDT